MHFIIISNRRTRKFDVICMINNQRVKRLMFNSIWKGNIPKSMKAANSIILSSIKCHRFKSAKNMIMGFLQLKLNPHNLFFKFPRSTWVRYQNKVLVCVVTMAITRESSSVSWITNAYLMKTDWFICCFKTS